MSAILESAGPFDPHDAAMARAVDDALMSLESGDIVHALEAIERGVGVSESHPTFAKRPCSEFQRLETLLRICLHVLGAAGESTEDARAVMGRIRLLKQCTIH